MTSKPTCRVAGVTLATLQAGVSSRVLLRSEMLGVAGLVILVAIEERDGFLYGPYIGSVASPSDRSVSVSSLHCQSVTQRCWAFHPGRAQKQIKMQAV
jgi:hypothetical protein